MSRIDQMKVFSFQVSKDKSNCGLPWCATGLQPKVTYSNYPEDVHQYVRQD